MSESLKPLAKTFWSEGATIYVRNEQSGKPQKIHVTHAGYRLEGELPETVADGLINNYSINTTTENKE